VEDGWISWVRHLRVEGDGSDERVTGDEEGWWSSTPTPRMDESDTTCHTRGRRRSPSTWARARYTERGRRRGKPLSLGCFLFR
jgi:hypothetical protein